MPQVEMSRDEAAEFLAGEEVGRLATCDPSGQPYITPLNYVYHDGRIYFHCANEGRKLDNIRLRNRVCFEVSRVDRMVFGPVACRCSTRYTSVLAFGAARIIEDLSLRTQILRALVQKFADGRPFEAITPEAARSCTVVEIAIDSLHGKRNVDPESG